MTDMGPTKFYQLPVTKIDKLAKALEESESIGLPLILTSNGKPMVRIVQDNQYHRNCLTWEEYEKEFMEWMRSNVPISANFRHGCRPQHFYTPSQPRVSVTFNELCHHTSVKVEHIAAWRPFGHMFQKIVFYVTNGGKPLAQIFPYVRLVDHS